MDLLEFAVNWPRGLEMILEQRSATNISRHLDDGSSVGAAMFLSFFTCKLTKQGDYDMLCSNDCACSQSLELLLECGSYIDIKKAPWSASQRSMRIFIHHIKTWREALANVARAELPPTDQAGLGLDTNSVLDHHTGRVIRLLQQRGINLEEQPALQRCGFRTEDSDW